jgi:cell division septal protein FtsQ
MDLFNKFKNYQDNVKSIDSSIILPHTLRIEIESYKELFNVIINEKPYILLENGTLVP